MKASMNPPGTFPWTEAQVAERLHAAVVSNWNGRLGQSDSQRKRRSVDKGTRGEVTGGKHLDGVLALIVEVARAAGTVGYELLCAVAPRVPLVEANNLLSKGR